MSSETNPFADIDTTSTATAVSTAATSVASSVASAASSAFSAATAAVANSGLFGGAGIRCELAISDPEKRGDGLNSYTVYTINTKRVTLSTGAVQTFSVTRRYNDFLFLHERLYQTYLGLIIPPLPEKAVIGRFSASFVESRRRGLERFLMRVLQHKTLSQSEDLTVFLISDEENLERLKLSVKEAAETKNKKGFLDVLQETMASISTSFGPSAPRTRTVEDVLCDDIEKYANSLETTFSTIESNTDTLIRRNKDLGAAFFELGLSFTVLSQFETEQQELIVGKLASYMGHVFDKLSVAQNQKSEKQTAMFHENLKEQLRIVDAIKQMLVTRRKAFSQLQTSQALLESKRSKLASQQAKGGGDRLRPYEQEVADAEKEEHDALNNLKLIDHRVAEEIQEYRKAKAAELKRISLEFVQIQIQHAQQELQTWNSVLQDMQAL